MSIGTAARGRAAPAAAAGGRRAPAAPPPRGRRGTSFRARLRRDRALLLMVLPAALLLLVYHYVPLLGSVIAFQDYSPFIGIRNSPFIGFENFRRLFMESAFWQSVSNTIGIMLLQLLLYFPVPIALALLFNSLLSNRVRTLVQTVVYLPHFFSWVLVITLFQQMLGGAGLLNQFLRQHGLTPFDVMTNPGSFKLLVTAQFIWKEAGWAAIVFLAALSAIDQALYEAAAVDGASRWRRLWHVTLPGLRPVIVLLLILRLGEALNSGLWFEQILLQRDAVGPGAAEVLDTYVYYTGIVAGDWALGAAAGLFKGVVGLVLILVANRIAHALGEQGVYTRE